MENGNITREKLAILGGPKGVPHRDESLFHWPIIGAEDEHAVLQVLRAGTMSGTDITRQFEAEWGHFQGTQFNLAHCNGTTALLAAMFGVGLGRGDELIAPSQTYWASALGAMSLGATMVFADIDPLTLCIDPDDIEHRITSRTKAVMVVHYCGHPCDMDRIMAVAARHKLPVLEDVSHAHGALYKGRKVGSIGDASAMSMMGSKGFAIGEGGMLCTNSREIYERAIAFCHYERIRTDLSLEPLKSIAGGGGAATTGYPLGGIKGRINQTCSAMGITQLANFPRRIKVIQDAMNRFWDHLEGVRGLRPHRPASASGSTMGCWYNPVGHYVPEELGGLSVERFIAAVNAEGGCSGRSVNSPMHLHSVCNVADVYGDGKPSRIAFAARDVRQERGSLPRCESLFSCTLGVPWFKHDRAEEIGLYASAYRKVAQQAEQLI